MIKKIGHTLGKYILVGITIGCLVWGWILYKTLESTINPVVENFIILNIDRVDGQLWIHGSMDKVRPCTFKSVTAYSGNALVHLEFRDTESKEVINRITGHQEWGWWIITPDVVTLRLYATHMCSTGIVTTELFNGVVQ